MDKIIIRQETPDDFRAVEEMTKLAFWNVNVPGCDEHYMLHRMRSHPDFIPELSLVTEKDGQIIAHVAYTKAWLAGDDGVRKTILTFGPLSVHPEHQRQGHGKRLLQHSFDLAVQMGYDAVVIFGNPENYVASGLRSAKQYGVSLGEERICPTALLVRELREGALAGQRWRYEESEACRFDPAEAEAFDRDFPQMEKGYRVSQELFWIYSRSRVMG